MWKRRGEERQEDAEQELAGSEPEGEEAREEGLRPKVTADTALSTLRYNTWAAVGTMGVADMALASAVAAVAQDSVAIVAAFHFPGAGSVYS